MTNQSFNNFSQVNSNSSFFADAPKNLQNTNLEMTNGTNPSSSFSKQTPQKRQSFGANPNFSKGNLSRGSTSNKRKVLSVSQILARVNQKKQRKLEQKKRKKPLKPIIPPKSFILLFKDKPEKYVYNRRIIDYKHCGLLQRYIGLGGKILPRRQTKLTAKQQRYVAKTIKSARIMGLLPFVTKERSFFR
uniref:ribosomal protein S18 n=1 Tax=Tetradesmus distendus TaxID=113531 RepID=UPI003002AFA3|nr:ribosomal protein S18 [Tetradesmus distendus]